MPPLWEFHLHYHEYLLHALADSDGVGGWETIQRIIAHWIETFSHRHDPVAWHPYCISRRLVVWSRLLSMGDVGGAIHRRWLASMAAQTHWLEHRLERDLGGNHLWENGRALATMGVLFEGEHADRWWSLGQKTIDHCLDQQLFEWGEHFERSPMYQADLATGLDELADLAALRDQERSSHWKQTASRMHEFLDAIRHPDGTIPLFGDCTLDAPVAQQSAAPATDRTGWIGEYYVHRSGGHQLTFDAGDMGPDDLPAHAHADLHGFELSAWGERLIVDSGTYAYSGNERQSYRSSSAHNVLIVDDKPLADTWSSFRMGHRGHTVRRDAGDVEQGRWVLATHDAYARFGLPEVTRVWFLGEKAWICLDVVEAKGTHRYASLVHWSPRVTTKPSGEGLEIPCGGHRVYWAAVGEGATLKTCHSVYSERFNHQESNECSVVRMEKSGPVILGWLLSLDGKQRRANAVIRGNHLVVNWQSKDEAGEAEIPWRGEPTRPGRGRRRHWFAGRRATRSSTQ